MNGAESILRGAVADFRCTLGIFGLGEPCRTRNLDFRLFCVNRANRFEPFFRDNRYDRRNLIVHFPGSPRSNRVGRLPDRPVVWKHRAGDSVAAMCCTFRRQIAGSNTRSIKRSTLLLYQSRTSRSDQATKPVATQRSTVWRRSALCPLRISSVGRRSVAGSTRAGRVLRLFNEPMQ